MTRQMADDEVLRVLRQGAASLYDLGAPVTSEAVTAARAAVAALQAERDALRGKLAGETARAAALEALAEQTAAKHNEACEWAERDRAALEALRGQVEGLADSHRIAADGWATLESGELRAMLYREFASDLDELLAIKERMG